jgi:hypothetical protein
LIYQHAADERDSDIARALDAMITGTVTPIRSAPTRSTRTSSR